MSATARTDRPPETTLHTQEKKSCTPGSWAIITALVVGVLLGVAAIVLYTQHINAIAAYATGGAGGLLVLGSVIAALLNRYCSRLERNPIDAIRQNSPLETLYDAAAHGDADTVRQLLLQGVDPKERPINHRLPETLPDRRRPPLLLEAIFLRKPGSEKVIKVILDHDHSLVNVVDLNGWTALFWAAFNTKPSLQETSLRQVQMLLRYNPDVNIQMPKSRMTALHAAVMVYTGDEGTAFPSIEMIETLANAGARWDIPNSKDKTPLQIIMGLEYAPWRAQPGIMRRLRELPGFTG